MKYTRAPEHDRRIERGDDFAGDAWLNNETGDIEYGVVGHDRNRLDADESEREFAHGEREMMYSA